MVDRTTLTRKLRWLEDQNEQLTNQLRTAQANERAAMTFLSIFAPPDATELIHDTLTQRWVKAVRES